jgi:hypothetical protein
VHTAGYNLGSVGICGLGTYGNTLDSIAPGPELLAGLVDLSAWECSRSLIHPTESAFFVDRVTPNITGHRDYNATACPGDYLYAELPSMRTQVWSKILTYTPSYHADYLTHDTPGIIVAGRTSAAALSLRNTGTLTWLAAGQNPVRVGYRWHDDQGGVVPGDILTPLPYDVTYGHAVALDNVPLVAPAQPGDYVLEWDLSHEGLTWFSLQGSPTLTVPVTVLDPNLPPRAYMPLVFKQAPGPAPAVVEARALWVPRWSYLSQVDVETIVDKAAAANFNILRCTRPGSGLGPSGGGRGASPCSGAATARLRQRLSRVVGNDASPSGHGAQTHVPSFQRPVRE